MARFPYLYPPGTMAIPEIVTVNIYDPPGYGVGWEEEFGNPRHMHRPLELFKEK
jgi:hypothetical protein